MRVGAAVAAVVLAAVICSPGVASAAEAQTVLDESGRVVPLRPRPAKSASPCGDAQALPVEAAKALVARLAAEEGFYPDLVLSVAKIESRYVSTALSDRGAYGLMQLTPETARRFGVELCDPEGNVRGGIRLLRSLHERYRNPLFILAAYNAGEDAVRKSRGVPPFPETIRFVADVLNDFYVWPSAADGASQKAAAGRVAAASLPGIVDIDRSAASPKPAISANPQPASPDAVAATRWNDGFVMHVD